MSSCPVAQPYLLELLVKLSLACCLSILMVIDDDSFDS